MKRTHKLNQWLAERMDRSRLHLSRPDALLQLSILGLLTGLAAGLCIIAFRILVEGSLDVMQPGDGSENFEELPPFIRFLLPIGGSIALVLMFLWMGKGIYTLGVARVLERMAYHQGRFNLRELWLQFFGAAIAIISGHSVGREGPHIFLGAASGSLLGQRLELPNNTIRTLVGCGTAAGIAASFNTPLAGVIFAIEVIMLDYSLASFIPIILSAVSATLLSQFFLGTEPAFIVPPLAMGSLSEILIVILLGLIIGVAAAAFIHLIKVTAKLGSNISFYWRLMLAGLCMGLAGLALPQVMGIGYDTVSAAMLGQYAVGALLAIALVKLVATSLCIGLGIPGGMIGPSLFIGATLGGLIGELSSIWLPHLSSDVGFFAMLGMGAMMGASLQAPLAALTALLELTHNSEIILPGMVAIVVANLTARELFRKESLFITMLKASGMDYQQNPAIQALRRAGVASAMNNNFIRIDRHIQTHKVSQLLEKQYDWILVDDNLQPAALMRAAELAVYIESGHSDDDTETIDLLEIPAKRLQVAATALHETLQEALDKLNESSAEAVYVRRMTAPGNWHIYGILTREKIEAAYKY